MNAQRQGVVPANSSFTPVPSGLLQRKCACGTHTMGGGQCADCAKKKSGVQRKLTIGASNDPLEREADRVAEEVMRMADGESGESIGPFRQAIRSGGDAVARTPILQRAEEGAGTPVTEGETPKEEGSRCPSWRADPESITKRAGEFYARNHLTPPSQATVERIECEPPISNGNHGCYVHFSDGLVLRVIVRATDIVVGTGPGPLTTEHPPPNTPLCWYEYSCPEGDLVLTVKKCQSSKPSGSSSPPAVAQRAATAGAPVPRNAPPIVHDVLASTTGQPLDGATRRFFESRLGHDFAHVRVHADAAAAEAARSIHALAFTVGPNIVFNTGRYSPETPVGRRLLAHELTHVVQQGAIPRQNAASETGPSAVGSGPRTKGSSLSVPDGNVVRRQPKTDGPTLRDLPIFLEKLESDVGQNLLDYGHHLYRAAALYPSDPAALKIAVGRYALGANVLKDTYQFVGMQSDTAGKLAVGTGILLKGLTLVRQGELTLDFQFDIGHGVKFETNLNMALDPKDRTRVSKGEVNVGLVRRF